MKHEKLDDSKENLCLQFQFRLENRNFECTGNVVLMLERTKIPKFQLKIVFNF